MTDEAKIAQQDAQIHGNGKSLSDTLRALGFYRYDNWPAGLWRQRGTESPADDTPACHGGSSAAEARADQSDAASGSAQARGFAPTPAQGLETASGEPSPARGLRFRPLNDVEAVFRDWFDSNTGIGGTVNAEQLAFEAFRAGAWWGLSQ